VRGEGTGKPRLWGQMERERERSEKEGERMSDF
jgi:hypothetical protein